MATSGLYGSTTTGDLVATSGAESTGLYGNNTNIGGTYFEWFIFYESTTAPATPTGGSWNFLTNTGTAPSGWSSTPPTNPTHTVWASISIVNSRSPAALTWTAPATWTQQGPTGTAATIAAGTTTTGAPGTSATVTNSGTSSAAVFNFQIPRGDVGATGAQGATGTAATVAVGSTTTLTPGSAATVTNSGTTAAAVFNFGVPQGLTGATGATGATGPAGMNWRGNWSSGTFYSVNDGVFDAVSGSSYIATATSTNQQPPNGAYWNLLAQKGANGTGVGTVTSVDVSGGTTGLTSFGGPITSSGTITLAGTLNVANGGTGATTSAGARTSLGATTVGSNIFTLANPSAITFPRFNADNTVSSLDAATFRTAIGAGTSSTTGTVTSVAASVPAFLSISGSPITASGTLAIGLSGTALPVANGGTGVTASSGANSVVLRDANVNISANSISEGYSNVAAAGTTTVLTVASVPNYVVTGSGGQTYQLPDATTLSNGANYVFNNNQSSGTIVVKNNSSTTVATIQSGGYVEVVLLSNATAAGTWDVHNQAPSNVSWSTNTFDYPGSITSATWNGVAVAISRGGTGATTATAAFNALAPTQTGNSGKYLTTDGTNTSWATNPLGTVTSVGGTGTVNGLTLTGTVTTSGNLTLGGTLDLSSPPAIGATAANTGAFTTLSASSTVTLSGGTANGVAYLNGSKVLTTGTALTFDGTNLGLTGSGFANDVGGSQGILRVTSTNNTANNVLATFASTSTANNQLNVISATTGVIGLQSHLWSTGANTTLAINPNGGIVLVGTTSTSGSNLLQVNGDALIYGLTVGRGAGAVATNTAVGASALAANTTGAYNTAYGQQALTSNTTVNFNGAFGFRSLRDNTTGASNNAFGYAALIQNTTGSNNVAMGDSALYSNTTGNSATAVGYQSLYSYTGSGLSVAVGYQSMYSSTTPTATTGIGYQALYSNTTGDANVALGRAALYSNTTASNSTAVGYQAAYTNSTGAYLTAVGYQALLLNTANYNSAFGGLALSANTTGTENIAAGLSTMLTNTTGSNNAAFGNSALRLQTTGGNNTALGFNALYNNTTASNNTAVGYQAGYSNTTGVGLVAIGRGALYTNTADYNVAVGDTALYANTTGASNTAIGSGVSGVGYAALRFNTTGTLNAAFGAGSLGNNTTGSNNTALGTLALQANTTASNNTALGYQAGYSNTTGSSNVFIGYTAGYSATTTVLSTFVGSNAGASISAGTTSRNTFIGAYAGNSVTTGSGNTFIGGVSTGSGNGAGRAVTTGNYNTILGAYDGNQGGLDIRTASNYIVLSDGDGNPRVNVDNSGNVMLGGYAFNASVNSNFFLFGNTNGTQYIGHVSGTTTGTAYQDFRYNGTGIGSITQSGTTAVLYNVTSDQRLKENIVDAPEFGSVIDSIKVRSYDWKTDHTHQRAGFIAQELVTVAPEAVHQPADPEDMMAVDYSKLVPMLVKEIQSLRQRLAALEAA